MPIRPRRLSQALVQGLFALAASGVVACALDTAGLAVTQDGASPSDAPTSVPDDAALPDAAKDAAPSDVAPPPDVGLDAPLAADAPVVGCDRDSDGHKDIGNGCGGDDCCDIDASTHPGQAAFFTTPDACNSFDYNCDGKVEKEFGAANCQAGFFTCSGDGFSGTTTTCGVPATYTSCSYAFFSCNANNSTKTQACR